eukprot:m.86559 g.86559  ORF g.86559 m.86559 type:complete len:161 (-) comp12813_c0_seq7:975-1457(-)
MKIITPCYPQQNASYTVNQSTLRLIIKEFQKGHEVMRAIMSQDSPKPWSMLWRKSNFFAAHQYYVMVRASAATQEDRTLFEGLVESKIRRLAEQLMRVGKVAYASPLPKVCERFLCVVGCQDSESSMCARRGYSLHSDLPCLLYCSRSIEQRKQRKQKTL